MGVFSGLSEKLNHVFSKITSRGKLSDLEIRQAMREIRVALLEADVSFPVVKDFIARVSEEASGEKILNSLTPGQQVVKIVRDELVNLMGGTAAGLAVSPKPPTVIMMCGLQGAGKTTMCGKLAYLLKKQGKRPLLAACDVYRPAAINQLKVVGKNVNTEVYEHGTQNPVKTAKEAVEAALSKGYDTVIIDTAGRLHINDELMRELEDIKAALNPTEILLTVDAMTGQDAVTVATTFNERLDITGVILTKLDGDTRGGAALSIRAVTGKPIKLCGIGEKPTDIEPFHPDRMASRILGMGDVLTLIEKAEQALDQKKAAELEQKMRANKFTLADFYDQLLQIRKMGPMQDLLGMIPGMGSMKNVQVDESALGRVEAIILSMTPYERENPACLNSSRKRRIALGCGQKVEDVNRLLKQFDQMQQLMKQMNGKGKKRKLPGKMGGFPGFPGM